MKKYTRGIIGNILMLISLVSFAYLIKDGYIISFLLFIFVTGNNMDRSVKEEEIIDELKEQINQLKSKLQ